MYGLGWSQFNQSFIPPNGYQSIYDAFQYKDANQLQGSPITGQFKTYDGSGYKYELRGKLSYIQGNLSLLQQMEWIDKRTRAVFIEFSSFNPNINLIMVSTILVEFLSTGSILTSARFDPLYLFGESGGISFKIISEILFMAFIVYFMIVQIKSLIKRSFIEYVSDFWTYIELFLIVSACVAFTMFLKRYLVAQQVLDFFKQTSGYGYMKLQNVNDCNQTLTYSLGLCVFFGTIKYLKILRFNKHISHLGLTMKSCFTELASFSMIFFFILIAFVQLMYLVYGYYLQGYRSMEKSVLTAFVVMLGKFDVTPFMQQNPILGPLIFSGFNIVMLCLVLNIFISIVTEAYGKIRFDHRNNRKNELNFFSHAKCKLINLVKHTFEKDPISKNIKYRDFMSTFPERIDSLTNYVMGVSVFSVFITVIEKV